MWFNLKSLDERREASPLNSIRWCYRGLTCWNQSLNDFLRIAWEWNEAMQENFKEKEGKTTEKKEG